MSDNGDTKTAAAKQAPEERATPKPGIERWISTISRDHMLVISTPEGPQAVRFSDFFLDVDTRTEEGKVVARGLRACGRAGRDIFLVRNRKEGEDVSIGEERDMLGTLRRLSAEGNVGIDRIRALFTRKELCENELEPLTRDADALITLALKTKRFLPGSLVQRKEKE